MYTHRRMNTYIYIHTHHDARIYIYICIFMRVNNPSYIPFYYVTTTYVQLR